MLTFQNSQYMQLRKMTIADADKMLEWKNYPETRKFAIASHEEIKIDDHYRWLKENIQYIQIIEGHDDICGAVRIQNNEVSIWIDRKFWGEGICAYVLDMVSEKGMRAKIVEGNIASMKCFIRAGFEPIDYKENYYIFQR